MFLIFLLSCNFKSNKLDNNSIQAEYVKAEIYCFCVYEIHTKNQVFINTCSTPASVKPYTLIKPDRLFYLTNDTTIIKRLKRVFFEKKEKIDTLTEPSDARLVVLLKKNDLSADTLVFDREYSFNFNEKYKFSYSFQVMDSIRSILNKKTISCPYLLGSGEQ